MRARLVPLFLLVATLAYARSGIPGNNPTLNPAAACVPVIEKLVTKPSAAYALRRVNCAYSGPLVNVYRFSDGRLSDISGTSFGLDNTTLSTFCASTICTINLWYDETGNGRTLQAFGGAVTGDPLLWASGAIAGTIGGRAAAVVTSATYNNRLYINVADAGIVGTTAGALLAVGEVASGGTGTTGIGWYNIPNILDVANVPGDNVAALGFVQSGALYSPPSMNANRSLGSFSGGADVNMPVTYTFGTSAIFAMRWNTSDGTPNKGYIGGGTPATNSSVSANNASMTTCIPGNECTVNIAFMDGLVTEAYTFFTEPSLVDTNFLGNNIATYFSLPWTNITL